MINLELKQVIQDIAEHAQWIKPGPLSEDDFIHYQKKIMDILKTKI